MHFCMESKHLWSDRNTFPPDSKRKESWLIVLMDGSLKEGNNWRSQSQTSDKPIRQMSKRLDSTRKELQEVKRSLGGVMEWALSAGTLRKSKGELSQGADLSSTTPWLWEETNFRKEERKQETELQRQTTKKCRNGSRGNQKSREVTWWEYETEGRTLIVTPNQRGRTQSGGGLLFSFFH